MKKFNISRFVRRFGLVAALAVTTFFTYAQSEALTNKSVMDLAKAGLDKSIIITTIKNANAEFDVSANGLIALKNAKVDDEIIATMVTKSSSGAVAAPPAANTSASAPIGNLELVNHPYYNNQPLDKVAGSVSTKARAFGYGGANSQYEVAGEKSKLRIPSGGDVAFVVNTGGASPELTLYKADIEKGNRIVVLAKVRMFSGAKAGGGSLSFSTTSLGDGIYKLVPSETLEAGEYFFATKSLGAATSIDDAFAFGID